MYGRKATYYFLASLWLGAVAHDVEVVDPDCDEEIEPTAAPTTVEPTTAAPTTTTTTTTVEPTTTTVEPTTTTEEPTTTTAEPTTTTAETTTTTTTTAATCYPPFFNTCPGDKDCLKHYDPDENNFAFSCGYCNADANSTMRGKDCAEFGQDCVVNDGHGKCEMCKDPDDCSNMGSVADVCQNVGCKKKML